MKTKNTSRNLYVRGNTVNPFAAAGPDKAGNERYWRWGSDNLFPNALALMSRRSPTHRRIINDKADYISGKGFTCDPERRTLAAIAERANGAGESLRVILNKLAFDKSLFGNAFLEIATDRNIPVAVPPGRLAVPGRTGRNAHLAAPRLDRIHIAAGQIAAALPGIRTGPGRDAAVDRSL